MVCKLFDAINNEMEKQFPANRIKLRLATPKNPREYIIQTFLNPSKKKVVDFDWHRQHHTRKLHAFQVLENLMQ